MSDKSANFLGGFILGAITGGVVGLVLASKLNNSEKDGELGDGTVDAPQLSDPESVEKARINLEQKIAQLNAAIDAVSHELSASGGNGQTKPFVKSSLESKTGDEKP